MAVKDKNEAGEEPAEIVDIEWSTAENELQLLQILCTTRPVGKQRLNITVCRPTLLSYIFIKIISHSLGISKYFQMACVVEKLATSMNREITAKSIWEHLGMMYDLKKMVGLFV